MNPRIPGIDENSKRIVKSIERKPLYVDPKTKSNEQPIQ